MNREFLDFVEDILDAMEIAELLIEGSVMNNSRLISASISL